MKKQKIALALGSGGARGIAHIGVIEEFESRGYEITSVAGTSMGAVVGGFYAAGKLNDYKEWLLNLDEKSVFALIDFTLSTQGFIKGEKVFAALKDLLPDCNIEDLPIKFSAVAADIVNQSEIVYNRGPIYRAMRASVAIPSVIMPVVEGDAIIVDGGVVNPVPVSVLEKASNGTLIAAVDVNKRMAYNPPSGFENHHKELKSKVKWEKLLDFNYKKWFFDLSRSREIAQKDTNYITIMTYVFNMMQDHLTREMLEKNPPSLVIGISKSAAGTFEFYRSKELIAAGREAAKRALDEFEGNSPPRAAIST